MEIKEIMAADLAKAAVSMVVNFYCGPNRVVREAAAYCISPRPPQDLPEHVTKVMMILFPEGADQVSLFGYQEKIDRQNISGYQATQTVFYVILNGRRSVYFDALPLAATILNNILSEQYEWFTSLVEIDAQKELLQAIMVMFQNAARFPLK